MRPAIASVSADLAYALGPDGKLYLGEVGRISRFDLNKPAFVQEKVIWAVRWVLWPPPTGACGWQTTVTAWSCA